MSDNKGLPPLPVYENGPEGMPRVERLPHAVIECLINHSAFRYLATYLDGENRDCVHRLIHDVAEEVLARVPAWPSADLASRQAEQPNIKAMVNRFLGWPLPIDFNPDAGISFTQTEFTARHPPIGTNLLTADQAKAMFEYCLADPHSIRAFHVGTPMPMSNAEGMAVIKQGLEPARQKIASHDSAVIPKPAQRQQDAEPADEYKRGFNDGYRQYLNELVRQPAPPQQDAQQPTLSRCARVLRQQGKAYPRTCPECGLGPCKLPQPTPDKEQP
jgi:hypothetical protein